MPAENFPPSCEACGNIMGLCICEPPAGKGLQLVNLDMLLPLLRDIQTLWDLSVPGDREDVRRRLSDCIEELEGV